MKVYIVYMTDCSGGTCTCTLYSFALPFFSHMSLGVEIGVIVGLISTLHLYAAFCHVQYSTWLCVSVPWQLLTPGL